VEVVWVYLEMMGVEIAWEGVEVFLEVRVAMEVPTVGMTAGEVPVVVEEDFEIWGCNSTVPPNYYNQDADFHSNEDSIFPPFPGKGLENSRLLAHPPDC
tara:strand:- start:785 stop:1081 length:297 start_codon:yes stop_codon:yes gene_type:complete